MANSQQENERLAKISDRYISEFINESSFDLLTEYRIREICKDFQGESCLELGCGEGAFTPILPLFFKKITVVDASAELIENIKAKYQGDNTQFVVSLFEDFTSDTKFDTILLLHVLEHVADPVNIIKLASQWLKKDGVMLLSVPNAESLHRMIGVQLGMLKSIFELNELDHALGHRRVYCFDSFRKDIEAAGLKTIAERSIFMKLLSNRQIAEWSPALKEACFEIGKNIPQRFGAEIYFTARKR